MIRKILLCRPDRLGDVVLTLPAAAALRERFPDAEITFLCSEKVAPVLEGHGSLDRVIKIRQGTSSVDLARALKKERFDASLHFFVEPVTALAAFRAGIPRRVGPFSKVWSLFLNERLRQSRSKCRKNEADYNLDIAAPLGAAADPRPAGLYLTREEKERARLFLDERGLRRKPAICIHPGGALRAKRWPVEKFALLAGRLSRAGAGVVVTAGPDDGDVLNGFSGNGCAVWSGNDLRFLMSLINECGYFVSNSTGPLHVASGLGVPSCSFFWSRKACSSVRWGPYPPSAKNIIFETSDEKFSDITADSAFDALSEKIGL